MRPQPRPLDVTVCSALAQGGIAHYSYSLCAALQAAGAKTTQLMYGYPEYDLIGYPHHHRVVRDLKLAISSQTKITSPFRNLQVMLATTFRSNVVHFQWSLGERSDRLHLPILRRLGKTLVYTAHDVLPHETSIMSERHARWLYRYPEAVLVHGTVLKDLLVERFDVDPARVHVVPHGNYNFIADTPGSWTRNAARASLGLDESDRVVLFFGLIREYKGLDTLIDACRIVKDLGLPDRQRLKLVIAGRVFRDHWNEGQYAARIRDAGLADIVDLHLAHIGMSDIARFFQAADVVAIPYKRGSQSGVLRLAYAFANAIVATRVGSFGEAGEDELMSLVEPGNPTAFAAALRGLLANPDDAQSLGARARRYADTTLQWDRIADATMSVYRSVLAEKR